MVHFSFTIEELRDLERLITKSKLSGRSYSAKWKASHSIKKGRAGVVAVLGKHHVALHVFRFFFFFCFLESSLECGHHEKVFAAHLNAKQTDITKKDIKRIDNNKLFLSRWRPGMHINLTSTLLACS